MYYVLHPAVYRRVAIARPPRDGEIKPDDGVHAYSALIETRNLRQMAELQREEVIWLDEREIVGLLIKVEARRAGRHHYSKLHNWQLP